MLVIGFSMGLIKMLQEGSKTLVNMTNQCLQPCRLGVGGNLSGLQLPNLVIRHLQIIIKSFYVQLHLFFKVLYDALCMRGVTQTPIIL
jgi:hypothetical protein